MGHFEEKEAWLLGEAGLLMRVKPQYGPWHRQQFLPTKCVCHLVDSYVSGEYLERGRSGNRCFLPMESSRRAAVIKCT